MTSLIDISELTRDLVIGAEGLAEIIQNVRVILGTPKGSVPLDREFGVSWHFVDLPTPLVRAEMTAEIFEAVPRYEPRVAVTDVTWEDDASDGLAGRMRPRVRIEVVE